MNSLLIQTQKLTLHAARFMADAARLKAEELKVPGAFAVVDDGGNLIYLERWDQTMIAAAKIAIDKAATAVNFRRPTKDIEDVIINGRTPMLALSGTLTYVPLMGGYPILLNGEIAGGIAVAGTLDAEKDEVVVLAALHAFENNLK